MARVLIIDDEEQIREVLRTVLERVGYEVSEASNGVEGIQIYREHDIDLVVTDIIMPEKGGIDTIMDLRRDYPDVKIIAVSGGGMCGDVSYLDMAIGVGADRAIGKPFVLDEFLEAVTELTETNETVNQGALEE
ncbi:MAG: response regulator [Candidatus Hydrogenedentota bacterium]|nr:MAG: response regulator [Candidatus Hydrogenedentota bacterium]